MFATVSLKKKELSLPNILEGSGKRLKNLKMMRTYKRLAYINLSAVISGFWGATEILHPGFNLILAVLVLLHNYVLCIHKKQYTLITSHTHARTHYSRWFCISSISSRR